MDFGHWPDEILEERCIQRSASSQDVDFNYWCVQNMSELPVLLLVVGADLARQYFSLASRLRDATGLVFESTGETAETIVNEITCVASSHNNMKKPHQIKSMIIPRSF